MNDDETLTAEEVAMLEALQAKKAKQTWNARETERLAKLKVFEPIVELLSVHLVTTQIEAINEVIQKVDRETYQRLDRLLSILRYDALPIAQQIELLSTPTPQVGTLTVGPVAA